MGKRFTVAVASAVVLAACFPTTTTSTTDDLTQADADAIASMMFEDLKAGNTGDLATKSFAWDTSVHPDARCSPQKLTPPQACASAGNVYTTINLTCPDPNAARCCGANPPCSKWSTSFNGQTKTLYNGCKTSPRVSFDGSLNGNLTAKAEGGCASAPAVSMTYNVNGSLTVRVDGRDVCPEGVFLTFHAFYYDRAIWSLQGNVCGHQVFFSDQTPPAVQCNGFGCPNGTFCGRCGQTCWSNGWADCCEGACPPGTRCVAGGKCQ